MGRRTIGKEQIRKIQQSKGSYFVSIPIRLMRELNWRERQKVVVRRYGKGIRIKDWPVRRSFSEGGKPKK